jgi:hypothetical protein
LSSEFFKKIEKFALFFSKKPGIEVFFPFRGGNSGFILKKPGKIVLVLKAEA